MREKIKRANTVLGMLSVLLITASLFVFPFPFVRATWIREVWGVTGLIHAFLFVVIGNRISKASLPAPLAGIGIVLNYEILTVFGFCYVLSHKGVYLDDGLFLAGTLILGFFLIWVSADVFKSICLNRLQRKTKIYMMVEEKHQEKNDFETDSSALIVSAFGYLVIFGLLYKTLTLDDVTQYGGLKILGVLISPLSFGGIGQEIDYYLQGKQTRFFCVIKSATHLLALASILWIIYRRLPLSSVVI